MAYTAPWDLFFLEGQVELSSGSHIPGRLHVISQPEAVRSRACRPGYRESKSTFTSGRKVLLSLNHLPSIRVSHNVTVGSSFVVPLRGTWKLSLFLHVATGASPDVSCCLKFGKSH